MKNWQKIIVLPMLCGFGFMSFTAMADDLYQGSNWVGMALDQKASEVGDIVLVLVIQSSQAQNSTRNTQGKRSGIDGSLRTNAANQYGDISFGRTFSGQGEVQRRDSLVAQISTEVIQVLPNGDFIISGAQNMNVNGEIVSIVVRGRIRSADISADNQILSSRIANAEINYNGSGFISKGARPGLIDRLFGFLGL